jgi:hypothetical protein
MNTEWALRRVLGRSLHCRNLDTIQNPWNSQGFYLKRGGKKKDARIGPFLGGKSLAKRCFSGVQNIQECINTGSKRGRTEPKLPSIGLAARGGLTVLPRPE